MSGLRMKYITLAKLNHTVNMVGTPKNFTIRNCVLRILFTRILTALPPPPSQNVPGVVDTKKQKKKI